MTSGDLEDILSQAGEHHRSGRYAEAIALYEGLVEQGRADHHALTRLASALRSAGRPGEALGLYDRLASEQPGDVDIWFNRGNALADLGRLDEAESSFARATEIDPSRAYPLLNRAIARARLGDEPGAIELYRRVLRIEPGHTVATHNLANLLSEQGDVSAAVALLRETIAQSPDLAEAHYNLGLMLLRSGDYAGGAAEYEWRWRTPGFDADRPDYGAIPDWDGRPFRGKRLLVHAEQGLGDTIQFSKLLGLVKSLGGDVTFHIPQPLVALMRSLPFDIRIASDLRPSEADFQVPLMSLIHRLKLTPGAIPGAPSHLSVLPPQVTFWARRLGLGEGEPAIGLVWQGNPASPVDRGRSFASAEQLAPFAALPGVRLIALQKLDAGMLEQAPCRSGWRVRGLSFTLEHPGPDLDGRTDLFVDTAAIMMRLDLVVSVCTAPLHLAGALGRPAIALLKTVPDWRWMTGTATSPWYPAMSLERQASGETLDATVGRAALTARKILNL